MRRLLLKCALLLASVALTCAGLVALDPYSEVGVVGTKLQFYRDHASEFDVVFVGSSYVYREIVPHVFDAETADRGLATRSFNFGIPGMVPPESYFVIDRILDANPHRLKWVVFELDYFREHGRSYVIHSRRFDYWHDVSWTRAATRGVLAADLTLHKKSEYVVTHLEAFARQLFGTGRGRAMVAWALENRSMVGVSPAIGAPFDGFLSLDEETAPRPVVTGPVARERYKRQLEIFQGGGDPQPTGERLENIDVASLRTTLQRIRERGARPILLVPPCLSRRADLIRLREQGVFSDLLAFNSSELYPVLYDPAYRYDLNHLNGEGAAKFSRLLAARFVELAVDRSARGAGPADSAQP